MPAAKPIAINLLGQEDLKHTPHGRIVSWALTYGRYIMIGTEIVVLLAFISRFRLDRKLTDLKEELSQKQAILEANDSLEGDIKLLQDHLAKIKQITTGQSAPLDVLTVLETLMPPDVSVENITISTDRLTASAIAGTTEGFSQFLTNLQSVKQFTRVDIGDIKKDPASGIVFTFTAMLSDKPK